MEKPKRSGVPVAVLPVSGRPMAIDGTLAKVDVFVAAWLPGTEGDGVADVLFGESKPSGKLSFTWPKGSSTSFRLGDPAMKSSFHPAPA